MKTLVERIRNRELAIENDGSVEELNKALLSCFPDDIKVNDSTEKSKFFYAHEDKELTDRWDYSNTTRLTTVSVKEVLADIEGESKEELLEKAKRDYPLGTKVKCAYDDKECTVEKEDFFENGGDIWESNKLCLYKECKDKWAEIISKPEPKTKVIYLNEEDKPKIEEPLTPFEWYNNHSPDSDNFEWCALKNSLFEKNVKEYAEYRNNFKPNDKPIEFDTGISPSKFKLIVVIDKNTFTCFNDNNQPFSYKGNLNNGKLKQTNND